VKFLAITLIVHDGRKSTNERLRSLEDAIERSSIVVGSPQQIIDKVLRYHERFGHEVMHLHAAADGLTDGRHRTALELFQAEIAPTLRKEIPSRPFPGGLS
jgi:alkanesulfonate monooxygenase SsuD/methylene tetrahydromethanopterin reductase-like flavin-dependent oxidoreductase (luciferase family)